MSTTTVVKLGGEVVAAPDAPQLCRDLATIGGRLVVVHGGGPQSTALSERLGLATVKVQGRRVTDPATLDVMKMVVAGKLNVDLCALLAAAGLSPVGLHVAVRATKLPFAAFDADLGLVGEVTGFDLPLLELLWSAQRVPVLACLGASGDGAVYNINADTVGNQLAAALRADRLFVVTSVPGVLRDLADPASRIATMTRGEARAAIADGTITGGMIPKLEEAIAVLDAGVRAVHILGAADLLRAVLEPGSVGTTLL